jgi:hypothetical protein
MELLSNDKLSAPPPARLFVIKCLELEFIEEMRWPGDVLIGTKIVHIGRCSLDLAQALFIDDRCVGRSHSTVVSIARETRRPLPLAEALIAQCRLPSDRPDSADGLNGSRRETKRPPAGGHGQDQPRVLVDSAREARL